MASLSRSLTPKEFADFATFRRAAGKVHRRFWPHRHRQFQAALFTTEQTDTADLIPDAEFVALLTAFRLVYAQSERSNFGRIANIAYLAGDADTRSIVESLRENWKTVPRRPWIYILQGEYFDPGKMIDTWLNGEVFHQNDQETVRVDLLNDCGAMALMTLQLTIRDLCFPILGLDNVCALLLDEPLREVPSPAVSSVYL